MGYPKQHLPELHNIELCMEVYDLAEQNPDWNAVQITEEMGGRVSRSTIQRWLNEPERYSPYVDDVAVLRAFKERDVYDRLSILEKNVFWAAWAPPISREQGTFNVYDMPTRDAVIDQLGIGHVALQKTVKRWEALHDGASA